MAGVAVAGGGYNSHNLGFLFNFVKMDPVGTVPSVRKRTRDSHIDWQMCFICQNDYGKTKLDRSLRKASEDGLKCLKLRASERAKYKDEHR